MTIKLLSADDFRDAAKGGEAPDATVYRFATSEPEVVGDEAARTQRFVFSDATIDHSGDSIDPKGWDLSIFNANPVALFSHMSWEPPIGRASNVSVKNGKLVGDIEFASKDVYPFADTIYQLVKGGFLKAVSVGFRPTKWAFTNDKERPYGIDFIKQMLLEISCCCVPCNPAALSEARSLGVDTLPLVEWAEKVLDNGDTVFMPRKDVEALRKQAGAPERRFYIQSDKSLTAPQVERLREQVKGWQDDPSRLLVLDGGLTLRTIGDEPAAPAEAVEIEATDETLEAAVAEAIKTPTPETMKLVVDLAAKAGRRISAANRTKLQAAMDMSAAHHEAMTACIKDVMGGDGDEPDEDPDAAQTDAVDLGAQPPGSVVVESDEHLTPEERRLKEVAVLRAGLPKAD